MPNTGAGVEKLDWELWDSGSPGAAGTTLTLFQTPIGQASKTLFNTNMRLAGQLQMPSQFDVYAVAISALPGATAANVVALMKGYFQLIVGHKTYVEGNLRLFTAGGGLNVQYATLGSDTGGYADFGTPDARNLYTLKHPVTLQNGEGFRCEMAWPSAPGDLQIYAILIGVLNRSIQ